MIKYLREEVPQPRWMVYWAYVMAVMLIIDGVMDLMK